MDRPTLPKTDSPPKLFTFLFPTIGDIVWIAVFLTVLRKGQTMLNMDGDLPLHLTQGRYMLEFGKIPLRDVFSHTLAGQPVAQHKWLAQVIFAFAERIFSLEGVVILSAVVIASAFWLVFKQIRRDEHSLIAILPGIFLGIVTSMVHWLTRPHVFTFLFLAAWIMVLDQFRKGNLKRWWYLPILMVLWVNMHGGYIAGLVTWFLFGCGTLWDEIFQCKIDDYPLPAHFWRYYLLAGVTSIGASLLNPSGFGLWRLIIRHLGNDYLASITYEFQSPNFHNLSFWPFLIMIGLLVVLIGLSQKKHPTGLLLNVAVWMLFGLHTARNIPLFAIVAIPLIVKGVDDLLNSSLSEIRFIRVIKERDTRIRNIDAHLKGVLWPVIIFLLAVLLLGFGQRLNDQDLGYHFDPDVFPVLAVDWLEDNPQDGEMFNEFLWGGYIQYRLWPDKRVFIDPNADFYGEDFIREYLQVYYSQEGWESVLAKYDVTWAILPPESAAADAINSQLEWDIIYEDDVAVIFRQ